jgi:hypothetical protein
MTAIAQTPASVPGWLKWAFTAFMAVLVPVYWANYGPANFLYFCDAALFLTLFAVWRDDALAASMAAVGILIPQVFWCLDFGLELAGLHLTRMTGYMFDLKRPLFLRLLSLFHGWLPILVVYLVWKLRYDRRALAAWTALAWALCLVAYFFLPAAGAPQRFPSMPRNIDYVFGTDDEKPQTLMAPGLYLVLWMLGLFVAFFLPAHLLLKKYFGNPPAR